MENINTEELTYNDSTTIDTDFLDLNLHEDSIQNISNNILFDNLRLFLQEVEIAIKLAPGDIWGIVDNINVSRYVFNKYITLNQVTNEIKNYIEKNCSQASRFSWTVKADFLFVDGKNLLHINMNIQTPTDMVNVLNANESDNINVGFLVG